MQRRRFLVTMAGLMQGLIACVVAMPGIRFLLNPWRSRRGKAGFLRIAPWSAIDAKEPLRVTVTTDRWDAYTHHPPGPIGSVWLMRHDDGTGEHDVRCLHTVCPHLGCGIDFSAQRGSFFCPCHASDFDKTGKRLIGPSPRDMDELVCRVTEPDENGERWIEVQYQSFQTGVPDRRPIT